MINKYYNIIFTIINSLLIVIDTRTSVIVYFAQFMDDNVAQRKHYIQSHYVDRDDELAELDARNAAISPILNQLVTDKKLSDKYRQEFLRLYMEDCKAFHARMDLGTKMWNHYFIGFYKLLFQTVADSENDFLNVRTLSAVLIEEFGTICRAAGEENRCGKQVTRGPRQKSIAVW